MADDDGSNALAGMLGTLNSTQNAGVKYLGQIILAIRETFPNWVAVPATATSAGVAGQVAYDSGFFYICIGPSTWVRVTLATF